MKKKAMTLVELIISVTITAVVILIVTVFLTDTINSVSSSTNSTKTYGEFLDFKETLNGLTKTGYPNFTVYSNSGSFDVLKISNISGSWAYIFGVVDLETKKLQKNHIYKENVLGYRALSSSEISTIESNSGALYDLSFHQDKLFLETRIYDFKANLYNTGKILDLYIKLILRKDITDEEISKPIETIIFSSSDLEDFNLIF